MEDIARRMEESIADLVEGLKLELVDIEVRKGRGKTHIYVTVDRPGGVTVDECATASGLIDKVIDRERLMSGSYVLEVSSPGVRRQLKKMNDYTRSVGKIVRVRLNEPGASGGVLRGVLEGVSGDMLVINVEGTPIAVRMGEIREARLDPDLPW